MHHVGSFGWSSFNVSDQVSHPYKSRHN